MPAVLVTGPTVTQDCSNGNGESGNAISCVSDGRIFPLCTACLKVRCFYCVQLWGKDVIHQAVEARVGVGVVAVVEAAAQDVVDNGAAVPVVTEKAFVCMSVTCLWHVVRKS